MEALSGCTFQLGNQTRSWLIILFVLQAITKDMFDEALRALADEDYLTVTGKTVRLL